LTYLNGGIHHQAPQRKDENALCRTQLAGHENLVEGTPVEAPRLIGSDLTDSDYVTLEARWINREVAIHAKLRRVDSLAGGEVIGRKGGNYAGILIPYFRPGSDQVREYRLRRDQPDLQYDSSGNLKPRQKYLSPPGRSNMLYVVPGVVGSLLGETELPNVITEGEFKTLALWRLAHHGSPSRARFLPLGVSGVYNWRGTIGKTVGPDGSRLDVKGAIRDLEWINWEGRRVVIAYDADAVTKELVRVARSELAANLRGRGALVGFLEWDVARGKGIDDHLALMGADTRSAVGDAQPAMQPMGRKEAGGALVASAYSSLLFSQHLRSGQSHVPRNIWKRSAPLLKHVRHDQTRFWLQTRVLAGVHESGAEEIPDSFLNCGIRVCPIGDELLNKVMNQKVRGWYASWHQKCRQ
jgi:hypothetical protein